MNPNDVKPDEHKKAHDAAEPVAEPSPPMDGKKPVPAGSDEVEKFLVTTDTGGGD